MWTAAPPPPTRPARSKQRPPCSFHSRVLNAGLRPVARRVVKCAVAAVPRLRDRRTLPRQQSRLRRVGGCQGQSLRELRLRRAQPRSAPAHVPGVGVRGDPCGDRTPRCIGVCPTRGSYLSAGAPAREDRRSQ